jgi:hypothetical protein
MNFLGASILVVLICVVLGGSRRVALLGMMAGVLFLTQAQQINVLGFNMFAIRFLELAGFIRVMGRREFSFSTLNKVDRALIWLYIYVTGVFLLRSSVGQASAIGDMVDAFLCYFTFRGLISNLEDLRWFLRAFLVLLAPYTLLVFVESMTSHSLFASLLAGDEVSNWRNGRPRCIGSFRQPDLMGMFAASFLPFYVGLSCIGKERKHALIGIGLCLMIVWTANSGGAAGAAVMGFIGWLFWPWRTQMRKVRWGIVGLLAALALVMKAPIWYIFAHISSITGGDGWHRSYLLDMAWRHLGQWWFWGMPISETGDWFPYGLANRNQADITNTFISFGLMSGLSAVVLLIVLLTRSFSRLGHALSHVRSGITANRETEYLLWGLGVTLAVHISNWFAITYFDQMYVVWFMQLAAISGLSEKCAADEPVLLQREGEPEVEIDENALVSTGFVN